MLWGGLRGSITLAMALAVTENRRVPADVQQFIAILATGFVLFTLLVNGTTLRFLVHWLRLDRLSPIDQALRHQVVALELGQVRDRLRQTAEDFGFLPQATQRAVELYDHRAAAEAAANTFDAALTDRDRVKLGLLTFAAQERAILLEIFRERGAPRRHHGDSCCAPPTSSSTRRARTAGSAICARPGGGCGRACGCGWPAGCTAASASAGRWRRSWRSAMKCCW